MVEHMDPRKLGAEIYTRIVAELVIDVKRWEAEPDAGEPALDERHFLDGGFWCEDDLKPMAEFALMAARVFCEAAAVPPKQSDT